jgi:4-azaleucine resistance transporter AzlC
MPIPKQVTIQEQLTKKDAFIDGVKICLPTVLGYLSIGFAAGVIEKAAGFTVLETIMLSLFIYAGSAQFIAAGMFAAGAPAVAIIITVFFVNIRHLLMSAALSPYFRHMSVWENIATGALLTDETFGVAAGELADKKQANYYWMLGLNVTAYVNWILANVLGALLGQWVAKPETFGLDFALTAMFIGLYVMQTAARRRIRADMIVTAAAVLITLIAGQFISGNIAVLLAIIGAATVGVLTEKWK